ERPATVLAERYALEEELGRSGTGMVWRATDRLLDRAVAVKLVRPELCDDAAFADHLDDQVRRVASLSAPSIARLLDTGEQDGVLFLVREHVDGASARALLDREGPRPVREAARIAIGALEGLAAAHEAGVLHLDLELEDVLIEPGGHVRVTDLGIGAAVQASRPHTEVPSLLGEDLAPEQREGEDVDERTDVFAVGTLLFELLTGAPPAGRVSPRELRPDVPRELDRVAARALARAPEERYADALSFIAALEPFASAPEPPDGRRPREGWLRAWLAAPLAIVAVAAALLGVGLWLGRLEVGGPLGIRPADPDPVTDPPRTPVAVEVQPAAVTVFDPPPGDGRENDSNLDLAIDGVPDTAWRSENYFDGRLNKPGVGLVFDLGRTAEVTGFRLWTPHPGYTVRLAVGDDPSTLVDRVGEPVATTGETSGALEGSGRYVLLWITSVVDTGDGNRAEVAEFLVEETRDG
ncbi:MAG TPA: protein kinase, partial [Actinomycetota bacterium]